VTAAEPPRGLAGATTRRRFLRGAAGAAVGLSAADLLAACTDTTVPGGADSSSSGPGGLPLARPDSPTRLPIYRDNRPIASGMKPEAGPLQLYNWAEYLNPTVIKSFEQKYGVDVEQSTFSTMDEAIAKLSSKAVQFDVFVPTLAYISLLVAGKIVQPLNHSYVPNLKANVWPSLADPWYDVGSRYTVPYTVYTTGIGWRNDKLPNFHPERLKNPYEAFWKATNISGRVGLLDDEREAISMALLRNGIIDVNTDDSAHVDGARNALTDLINAVNLRFDTNEYQHLIDGSSWLHQAWSGDMAGVTYYLPKGMSPKVLSYWWPSDGRGLINNDTMTVLRGAKNPVLGHLFLDHILNLETALENFTYVAYQQPLIGFTPEKVLEGGVVPPNLSTTIVRESQFPRGYAEAALSQRGLNLWESAWAQVKST
jgi:spermidine/putrescine transport system substrate-binding protein